MDENIKKLEFAIRVLKKTGVGVGIEQNVLENIIEVIENLKKLKKESIFKFMNKVDDADG